MEQKNYEKYSENLSNNKNPMGVIELLPASDSDSELENDNEFFPKKFTTEMNSAFSNVDQNTSNICKSMPSTIMQNKENSEKSDVDFKGS